MDFFLILDILILLYNIILLLLLLYGLGRTQVGRVGPTCGLIDLALFSLSLPFKWARPSPSIWAELKRVQPIFTYIVICMQHEFYMQMAMEGGFKENKRREACLAAVKKLLVVFLGSLACGWW